jgi:HPt (histidine-containing phosphotransfer) domain-containing protein
MMKRGLICKHPLGGIAVDSQSLHVFDQVKKLIYETLGILVDSFTEELEKLHGAREKEDWPSIEAIGHKLKGDASYCGTTRLKEACSQMEISVKTDKRELFANLYQQMLAQIDAVKEAVRNKSH